MGFTDDFLVIFILVFVVVSMVGFFWALKNDKF